VGVTPTLSHFFLSRRPPAGGGREGRRPAAAAQLDTGGSLAVPRIRNHHSKGLRGSTPPPDTAAPSAPQGSAAPSAQRCDIESDDHGCMQVRILHLSFPISFSKSSSPSSLSHHLIPLDSCFLMLGLQLMMAPVSSLSGE
jgi:hypothetical protein